MKNFKLRWMQSFLSLWMPLLTFAAQPPEPPITQAATVEQAVWVNEAIVATYTYNYQNFMTRQQDIAHYFTSDAWIAYSTALNKSKLIQDVQKNKYEVTAVALLPPTITLIAPQHWQGTMPLLVLYKNPAYQQKQTLQVTIDFSKAPSGQGVRGYALNSLATTITSNPCQCCTAKEDSNS